MSKLTKALIAAVGNAGAAGEALYVEDVFSTYLYEGNGGQQTINNGIALGHTSANYLYLNGDNKTDNSSESVAISTNGTVDIDTAEKYTGTGSYEFTGGSNYLFFTAPEALGANNFTLEFYGRNLDGVGTYGGIVSIGSTSGQDYAGITITSAGIFYSSSGTAWEGFNVASLQIERSDNLWHHYALVRNGIDLLSFKDGVLVGSTKFSSATVSLTNQSGHCIIGTKSNDLTNSLTGNIDSFRIVTGTAIYTKNFTPPVNLDLEEQDDDKGGLVWIKNRDASDSHYLADTERSTNGTLGRRLESDTADSQTTNSSMNQDSSFNSDGFTVASYDPVNRTGQDLVSWTFRKAEKFFDVVTYTGDGTGTIRDIPHNLGVKPSMVIIKRTDASSNWKVGVLLSVSPYNYYLHLNETTASGINTSVTEKGRIGFATDSIFRIYTGTSSTGWDDVNASGGTYVAYVFGGYADDGGFGDDGSESIIKCGSFTASTGVEVDLGFEPQWVLTKSATNAADWYMFDNMRGWGADRGSNDSWLFANTSGAESNSTNSLGLTPTGFTSFNANGQTYIYIAIRRPMKTPESGTEVLSIKNYAATTSSASVTHDIVFDAEINANRDIEVPKFLLCDQLRGIDGKVLISSSGTSAEQNYPTYWSRNGMYTMYAPSAFDEWWASNSGIQNHISYAFKRATGFFDMVAYTGTGSNTTQNHNLGVAPEMIIVRRRSTGEDWLVYHSATGNQAGTGLNETNATYTGVTQYWNSTSPTDTVFSLGTHARVNTSTSTYISYLFASLDGVSKVGSFAHTQGSATTVDCGFSNGARFVLWKKTNGVDGWQVYDTERGIVAGADPFLQLNSNSAEISEDLIDPDSSGFAVASGKTSGDYIFLAIA